MEHPEEEDSLIVEAKAALEKVVTNLEEGDKLAHIEMRAAYRKHELYWHGVQKLLRDSGSGVWLTPEGFIKSHQEVSIPDSAMGDRSINVYRAHGESIIAALTTGLPTVKFFPDDADSSEDINTAKAASKISELIQQRNEAPLKFIYALFLMYNQGLVFAYGYHDKNKKYGVTEKSVQTGMAMESLPSPPLCPNCEYPFEEEDQLPDGSYDCEQCNQVIPQDEVNIQNYDTEVPQFETVEEPKSCEVIELFGPLHVKIAPYARKFSETPYLILELEEHYSYVRELYPEIFEKIVPGTDSSKFGRPFRTNFECKELNTIRKCWLRPWAFNVLPFDDPMLKLLKEKFPNGCCVTFVNDLLADVDDDDLETYWTPSSNPLSGVVHADPLGAPLMPIQEIRTEIVDLIVETLEKGIPQTFADPDVLDFQAYSEAPNEVGMVYPAKTRGPGSLDSAFAQLKTANLSDETRYFLNQLEQDAQFVGGAFPSIFGGVIQGGSGTAKEYEMSRNQALQRLSTTWKVLNSWWANVMEKAVKSYIKNVQEDDKMVKPQGDSFINVWIKKEELAGKIGGVEAETSEQFPTSWVQQRGMLLELISMANPYIDQALYDPENTNTVGRIIGIPGIKIPGEADRDKQLAEIAELLKAAPIMEPVIDELTGMPSIDEMTGQPAMMPTPSVPIDMEIDNHEVHDYVCQSWAVSSVGRMTKVTNPQGYMNVLAHMIAHRQAIPPAPMVNAEPQKEEEKAV